MRSSRSSFESAQFRVLSDNQIEDLHLATLEILRRTGVRIYSEEGVELLRKAGANISDGNRCRIPPSLVEWAIRAAPPSVTLFSRDGNPALRLEDHRSYFGTGPSVPNIIDPYSGERRPVVRSDVANVAMLCDALPNIDFVMSLGVVSDCPEGLADREEFAAMVLNTNKPIVGWAYEVEGYADILDMGTAVRGSLEELQSRPFFALFSMSTPPLQHSQHAMDQLIFAAEHNMPAAFASAPMMGASVPIPSASSIAIVNAEVLSALLVSQLKREGAPFICGGGAHPLDMRAMVLPYAAPEAIQNYAAVAELAHHYHLPNWGYAGTGDSKVFDEQAVLEGALTTVIAGLSGANLVHCIGTIESGLATSLELVVAMDELLSMMKPLIRGIEINDETLALDLIDQVGPGGDFLGTDHTLQHYKDLWYPSILDRRVLATWEEEGRKTLAQRANETVKSILESYQPQQLGQDVQDRITEIVRRAEDIARARM
jgi:trimethylamine---corrinoid protein Co-methyltransferase